MTKAVFHNDDDFIDGIKRGNNYAVATLYRLHYGSIEHFIVNNSGSQQDAKDIYQEAFVVLVENIKNGVFRAESKIKTYLYSICRRQWLKELSKRQRYTSGFDDFEEFIEIEQAEVDDWEARDRQFKHMFETLAALGEPCNTIIRSYYIEKLSMEEISELMGYTNSANAKNQKYKCFKRLKKLFFGKGDS